MTNAQKMKIHLLLFVGCFLTATFSFERGIEWLDQYWDIDLNHSMFYWGVIFGLVYNLLELIAWWAEKQAVSDLLQYAFVRPPNYFVLSAFFWYFYTMFNKVVSSNKEDIAYFQAILLAFSVFFLLVRIGREIKTIRKAY